MQLLQNQKLDQELDRRLGGSFLLLAVGALVLVCGAGAAYAGPFSDPGHAPSSILSWATEVEDFERGPMDIASPELGSASFGVPANTLGVAESDSFFVYSLGDGGWITLFFGAGIADGAGDDLAVFENGFFAPGGFFGEFAFVEVSTNGIDYARFESESLQAFPVSGGEVIDPSDYRNFAGDQPLGLGTGFDLSELASHPAVLAGAIDLNQIWFVRIIDVIGDGTMLDSLGFPVYDPYPTAFASGGFDLEAVGVLHEVPEPGLRSALGVGLLALFSLARRGAR